MTAAVEVAGSAMLSPFLNICRGTHHIRAVAINNGALSCCDRNAGARGADELQPEAARAAIEYRPLLCGQRDDDIACGGQRAGELQDLIPSLGGSQCGIGIAQRLGQLAGGRWRLQAVVGVTGNR